MAFKFANNARSTLASPIASGDTTCSVVAGTGTLFPTLSGSDHFRATISDSTNEEIVDVTARSTDTFTMTRAQEGTSAHDFAADATVALLVTKEVGESFLQSTALDTDGTLAANSDSKIATQKATKTYVDAKVAGLSWKQAVRAATTAAGTLSTAFANGQVIDGVTLVTGDRILVKNQSSAAENGIYVVAASGAPARSTDASTGAELVNAACYVSEGTANADTQWTCTTNATITPGSTSLAFAQLTSGGSVTDATIPVSDITTNNVTSSAHGFAPKAPADATKFLNGAATPAYAQVKDSDLATTDITTNNRSTSKHGFGAKFPNDATKFEDGTGSWRALTELDVGAATHDFGNTGTALTLDWSLATQGKCTATGNATITHSNMVAGKVYTLEYYTGAGSFTAAFASTNYGGGTAPVLTVTASKLDVFTFVKLASGTIVGGIFAQNVAP